MSLELEDQYEKIYRYCYFKVINKEVAEDLTQETFLKFFSHNNYINHGKALAYMYTIAKNLCIDYFRKGEEVRLEEDMMYAKDEYELFETNMAVRDCIHTLPEDMQEILMLRFANELGMGEIGEIMGMSRFSVHRRMKEAIRQLKEIVKEEDFHG